MLASRSVAFILLLASASGAHAANAISKAIEQAKPCKGVKVKKFGVSIGVDAFKSADLQSLHVDVDGNDAKISFSGSLACQTSDSAVLRGDASAKISAVFALDLAACAFRQNSVQITGAGGSLGFAIEAAKAEIEAALENGVSKTVRSLCK
jgi:hypothetical protein